MKRYVMTAAAVGFGTMVSSLLSANAAAIKIIGSNALKPVLEELAPLHSITSSASASSFSGIWRPSAFAVVRLMASSNFVGC